MASKPLSDFRFVPRIIDAGTAGMAGVICVFPIDAVKTRMHNQVKVSGQPPTYNSILDCGAKLLRDRGFFGMYRGSAVNILLITPEKAIKLVANDGFRHLLTKKDGSLSLPREMLAGGGAGTCQIIVTTPMELLKIHGQMLRTKDNTQPVTSRQLALQIWRKSGIRGLYRGVAPTFMRDCTFSMIYFPLFAHLNDKGKKGKNDESPFYHRLLSGLVAGGGCAFLATPFDVIKTRLQTLENKGRYLGVFDCATKIWREEGRATFLTGATLRVMAIGPLFAIAQMVYRFGIGDAFVDSISPKHV